MWARSLGMVWAQESGLRRGAEVECEINWAKFERLETSCIGNTNLTMAEVWDWELALAMVEVSGWVLARVCLGFQPKAESQQTRTSRTLHLGQSRKGQRQGIWVNPK